MSIQALREQRAAVAKALKEHVEKEDWNAADDQAVYDKGLADLDAIDAKIARIAEANAKIAAEARADVTEATEDRAHHALRRGDNARAAALDAFAKWLKGGDRALDADDWSAVRAEMSTAVPSEGGFTVPTEVASRVMDALKAFGGMRSVATVISTTTGAPMQFPTSDGTSEEGEVLGENASATDLDASFGLIELGAFKYSSKVVAVPIELLQDSTVDVESFVRARLATRLGRIENRHFTIGTGVNQPRGVQVAAPIGHTAANGGSEVTAVKYDSLVETQHSVDPAYRDLGNTRWMFNDNTMKAVRKIVDGQSRPIFVPGYETGNPLGSPDTILGRPVTVNQSMPDMAAGKKSILFGDFSYYTIRDVMAMELFRFTDSAYAKKGQVGFLAMMRCGGALTDVGGAVKAFKNAAT